MKERYIVVTNTKFYQFITDVREHINNGYQPIGGLCVVVEKLNEDGEPDYADGEKNTVYYQSLYK